jgi:hypothetical protein
MPRGGKLATIPSCWATRSSLALTDTAIRDHDGPAGQKRREEDKGEEYRALAEHLRRDCGVGEQPNDGEEKPEHRVGERQGGNHDRGGLAQDELLSPDRRGEQRLECPLLTLADNGVGGERRKHDDRNQEQEEKRKRA